MTIASNLGSTTPTARPGVHVIGVIDASEEVVEPFLAARVDSLEKAKADAGASLDASVAVYRAGATPGHKVLKGLGYAAGTVAPLVIGALTGGPVGLALGAVGTIGMFVLGLGRQALGEFASAHEQHKVLPDPEWKGLRTYQIVADRTSSIDTPASLQDASQDKPQAHRLTDFLAANMEPYRSNIVFVAGHGLAYRSTASMQVGDLAQSLASAEARTGGKPDVLVMESCLMGNMEAMNELKDTAHVALVSEETLAVSALPIQQMMADAAKNGGTPQEIGRRMVEMAGKDGKVSTLAAIDLDKMGGFMQSVDTLGTRLSEEIQGGHKAAIQSAVKDAMKFPNGGMNFVERGMLHLSDFGGFLDALAQQPLSAPAQAAVADARQQLGEVVIARANDTRYAGASGLSFQNASTGIGPAILENNPEMGHYDRLHLPDGWKQFIADLGAKTQP